MKGKDLKQQVYQFDIWKAFNYETGMEWLPKPELVASGIEANTFQEAVIKYYTDANGQLDKYVNIDKEGICSVWNCVLYPTLEEAMEHYIKHKF